MAMMMTVEGAKERGGYIRRGSPAPVARVHRILKLRDELSQPVSKGKKIRKIRKITRVRRENMCFGHRGNPSNNNNYNNNNNARPTPNSRPHYPQVRTPQPQQQHVKIPDTDVPSYTLSQTRDRQSTADFPPPSGPPPPFIPSASEADLPPPPAIRHDVSPTSNAPKELSDAGERFCLQNPLEPPQHLTADSLQQISTGALTLVVPPPPRTGYANRITMTSTPKTSLPIVSTSSNCPDTTLLSSLPLYAAGFHHPANTGLPKSIYFEIRILSLPRRRYKDAAVAIGFVAKPYPLYRLPGWHRGSLGVHADDGHRFCNDSYGGKDFVRGDWPVGERVGIGMSFGTGAVGGGGGEVWLTRNGERVGGWRLDEEVDGERDGDPTVGLDGRWDVYAALGVWGGAIKVEVLKFESV